MVSVRDFLRRFFVANSIQTGGDAPITPTRRRRKFSTRPGIRQRRECAMSRGSPRKYEWGELPMALQAREVRSLTSLFSSNAREIQRYTRENGPFSARPENLKNNRTPANLGCFDASGYRTFHSACVRNFPDALLGLKKSKRDRT